VCGLLALFAVRSPIACCCFQAHLWRLQFCAQQKLVVLCFVFCLFWHCTLVHFGLFSSLNLMMRSSPARLKKNVMSELFHEFQQEKQRKLRGHHLENIYKHIVPSRLTT
jgi:hypothetical protein